MKGGIDTMLLKDEVEMLRRVPYFSRVEPCKLKLLAFTSQRVRYQPGDVIFHEGETPEYAFVVLRGEVEFESDGNAKHCLSGTADAGSILGEMCLLSNQPRAATASAKTAVEALRIGRDCLMKLVSDNPRISVEISRVLAQSLRAKEVNPANALRALASAVSGEFQ